MKKNIYISFPIHGNPNAKRDAERMKDELIKMGYTPVSPLDISKNLNEEYDIDLSPRQIDYLLEDLKFLASCDGIYFHKDYNMSMGCKTEFYATQVIKRDKPQFEVLYAN